MKRKLKKLLVCLIVLGMLLSSSGCSAFSGMFGGKKADEPAIIYRARIELPYSTGVRAVVEQEGAEVVSAYLTARAYIKQLEEFDTSDEASFDAENYLALVEKAMKALEVAEALSADLEKNACYLEMLQRNDYTGLSGEATIKFLSPKEITGSDADGDQKDAGALEWLEDAFMIEAKAAQDDEDRVGSLAWAEKYVKQYDEAPAGRALRTLAEQTGKDVKYVYSQLKMAQAIIEKGASDEEADLYNKAYEAAVFTKAACSTAAFICACIATGGTAAGFAHGVAAVNAAVNGINAVLDIGSAYTILSTNGEGNEYTEAFDQTSQDFGIVTFVAGTFGAGTGFYDATKTETAANIINSLLFFVSQKDYVDEKSTQLMSMALEPSDNGVIMQVMSTEKGNSPAQKEAMGEVLENGGVPAKEIEKLVEQIAGGEEEKTSTAASNGKEAIEDRDSKGKSDEAVEDRDSKSGKDEESKTPSESPELNPESDRSGDDFPDPIELISQYDRYTDPSGNFDVDKYIETLRSYLNDLAELENLDPGYDEFEEAWEEYLIETYGEDFTETAEESSEASEAEPAAEESSEVQEASAEESHEEQPQESSAAPEPESSVPEEPSAPESEPEVEESSAPEPEPEPAESSAPEAQPEPEPEPAPTEADNPLSAANIAGKYYLAGTVTMWGDAEGSLGFDMTVAVTATSETSLHMSISYGVAGDAERDVTYDPATGETSAFGLDEVICHAVFSYDVSHHLTITGYYEAEGTGASFTVEGSK